jgi:hypothetical protein
MNFEIQKLNNSIKYNNLEFLEGIDRMEQF